MLLTLRCRRQCSLVKRQTQPTSPDLLIGLDRAWEENEERTQPGTLVPSAQRGGLQRSFCSCISSPLGPLPMTGQDKEPGVEGTHPAAAGLAPEMLTEKPQSSCWPASSRTGRPAGTQAQLRALVRGQLISAAAERI